MSLRDASSPCHALREPTRDELERKSLLPRTPAALAAELRARHSSKIQQLKAALEAAGYRTLDQQANALGLSRSTTWTIVAGKHKTSGLSAITIKRMLQNPKLPAVVRATIVEYVSDKAAGRYGHTRQQLRRFSSRLNGAALSRAAVCDADSVKFNEISAISTAFASQSRWPFES